MRIFHLRDIAPGVAGPVREFLLREPTLEAQGFESFSEQTAWRLPQDTVDSNVWTSNCLFSILIVTIRTLRG